MQAIRTIRRIDKNQININIPDDFLNKEVEIIIIPIEDISIKNNKDKDFSKYFGITGIDNIEEEISKIRNEWDR